MCSLRLPFLIALNEIPLFCIKFISFFFSLGQHSLCKAIKSVLIASRYSIPAWTLHTNANVLSDEKPNLMAESGAILFERMPVVGLSYVSLFEKPEFIESPQKFIIILFTREHGKCSRFTLPISNYTHNSWATKTTHISMKPFVFLLLLVRLLFSQTVNRYCLLRLNCKLKHWNRNALDYTVPWRVRMVFFSSFRAKVFVCLRSSMLQSSNNSASKASIV